MQEIGRLFARALRRAKRPVVFLIDDLDRCDATYVVEFLEAVQTLVRDACRPPPNSPQARKPQSTPGPYVFVAADGRWIRSSYERHYDSFRVTTVPGRPLGYLFLEKIFQLHLRLPSITATAKRAFLLSLLVRERSGQPANLGKRDTVAETAKAAVETAQTEDEVIDAVHIATSIEDPTARMDVLGDAAVKFSQPEIIIATQHALTRFGMYLEPNPRSMKLFVNTYGVLRSLRPLEEVFIPSGPLALWTVLEIRWPYLADYLRAHPDAVERGEMPTGVPDDIVHLLSDSDVALVLEDNDSGPLSADLIRRCAGSE